LRLHIKKIRITVFVVLLIIIIVTTFSYLSLDKIQKILIDKSFSSLITSRDIKKQQVKDFFARKIIDIEAVARSSDIALLINELESINVSVRDGFAFNNQAFLSDYTKKHGYLEMFILSVNGGKILYHQKKAFYVKSTLKSSKPNKSGLTEIWEKTLNSKRVVFLDMKEYDKENRQSSILMGAPVYIKGVLKSVLVFRISNWGLSKIMNFRNGYGKTQEDYLVGSDNLRRSNSMACRLTHGLRVSSSNPIKGRCNTKATTKALAGGIAQEIVVDYDGNRVLSAYSPLIINQDLKWGILAEIDEEEVLILPNSIRHTLMFYAVIFILLILAIIFFLVYKMIKFKKLEVEKSKEMNQNLRKINRELSESEYQVILKNEQLEIKVDEVITRNKQNQTLLFQQSKMAAMGEMIGNIAHQWRQPLNALSALNVRLGMKYQVGKLSDKEMLLFEEKSNHLIQRMSSTIDDFRNFFYPNKSPKWFSIEQAIEEAIHFIESGYNINNIKLINYTNTKIEIKNHKNELIQVLLNIFNNSKDAIKSSKPVRGVVIVDVMESKKSLKITIQDNGGGINQEVIDRVFEPYFTTKFQDEGTGIGLYMSKMIVEESMYGKLTLENSENGVLTTIEIDIN